MTTCQSDRKLVGTQRWKEEPELGVRYGTLSHSTLFIHCWHCHRPLIVPADIGSYSKHQPSSFSRVGSSVSILLHYFLISSDNKNCTSFCHSFFSHTAPVYVSDLLRVYSPSRQLRSSSDSRTLRISHIKTKTFGQRSFSHAAPSVWNSLPHDIRHIQSVTAFKTALKTHLFKSYLC